MSAQRQLLELVPGEVLDGKYRIERLLGVGGMGVVYMAQRLALQDKVAIKSILAAQDTEINRARFLREARAAASIRHPNVVKIFDFGEPSGRPPYTVMEYLAGPTLAAVIRSYAPLPLARALWIFSGLCAAVEAGHRRGVVHRDLKPGNVILSRSDDDSETVKVLDFGLARLLTETEATVLTRPGVMLGTCSYMSPELIEDNLSSTASDVYALGVVFYEMVTGKSPFRGDNTASTILKIVAGDYPRPTDLVPELPQEVCLGIEAALSRKPEHRPSSPEELAARVGAPLAASAVDPAPVRPPVEVSGRHALGHDLPSTPPAAEVNAPPDPTLSRGFIGRATELHALRREFRMTLHGRARIVVIKGDVGVGKSRLLGAFGQWARQQGAVTLAGRFFAYEGDHPPPYQTFQQMIGASMADGSEPRAAPTTHASTRNGPNLVEDKWRAFASLTESMSARAKDRPLVLLVDDLQWSTALDLEFLAYLQRALEVPIMVLGTARSETEDEDEGELGSWLARLGSQRNLAALRLQGFAIGEVRAWFQTCFPGIRIHPQDLRQLAHATSGNPYYLTEVVGQLVQTGRIAQGPQGYSCAPLAGLALPQTVQSVVRAKLEGLDEDLRAMLELASVIGEELRFEVLLAALELSEATLESLLEQAVARRLLDEDVRSPASDFRFETSTLRSVLYEDLSRRKRRRLHRKVVDALLTIYGDEGSGRIAGLLCYHHHAMGADEATLRWGLRAAADTLARYDHDHAETSLRRARQAAQSLHDDARPITTLDAAELDRLTGLLYLRIGRLEEADLLLQRALETATQERRLDITLLLSGCQLGRGLLEASIDLGQAAIDLAKEIGDRPRELQARLRTAEAATAHGELDAAALLIEPILEADDQPKDKDDLVSQRALASAELACIRAQQGSFDLARGLAAHAQALAQECGDPKAEHRSISALGQIHLEGNDLAVATQHLEIALDMARRLSLRRREGLDLHYLATCGYHSDEFEAAESRAREALAIFIEIGDLASEGDCRVNLGRIRLARGAEQEGLEMLEAGRELCATVGRRIYEGIALLELGVADTARGALPEAREQLERASECFGSIDSLYLWRSELALAKLALAEDDRERAATHTRRAAHLVEILRSRLGHTLDHEAFERTVAEVQEIHDRLNP